MEYRLSINPDIYCEKDLLGFDRYIDTLGEMINYEGFRTPFCIGILGKSGSGKTSFMHLLEKRLSEDKKYPLAIPVWFNPWMYEKEEHIIIPLLKTMEHEIRRYRGKKKGIGKRLSDKIEKIAAKIEAISETFAHGINEDLKPGNAGFRSDASIDENEERIKRNIKKTRSASQRLSFNFYEMIHELKNAIDSEHLRIVIFIDDLDRCMPDGVVEFLRTIKLFLDIEGFLLILGINRCLVEKRVSSRDFLDKIIQLPVELPVTERGRTRRFIESLMSDNDVFKEYSDIIEVGVGDNPRTLKRFINLLSFTVRTGETLKQDILNDRVELRENDAHKKLLEEYFIPLMYIKWTIIIFLHPEVYSDIKRNRKRFLELQKFAGGEKRYEEEWEDNKGIQTPDERLRIVLAEGKGFPDDDWLIERFVHLTESTVIAREREETLVEEILVEENEKDVSEEDVSEEGEDKTQTQLYIRKHKAGNMVLIPKGVFLCGETKEEMEIDYDYYIDVCPVTNKQYKEFVDETDHNVPYKEEGWAAPYNWDQDSRAYPEGLSDHPVVLVSYNDAVDYCKWRARKEGEDFRLPTEEEWEKAARGVDGREYPWGDKFDYKMLNCADNHVGKVLKDYDEWVKEFDNGFYEDNKRNVLTTQCGKFSDGVSPYGCFDMAGNVWEWTDTIYDYEKNERVMRGGSWVNLGDECRCNERDGNHREDRTINVGFRCVRVKTKS